MKHHSAILYGLIVWGVVLLGTFAALVAWWSSNSVTYSTYVWLSLIVAVLHGVVAAFAFAQYQRRRWIGIALFFVPHILLWALMLLTKETTTIILVLPWFYSLLPVTLAWLLVLFAAERHRRLIATKLVEGSSRHEPILGQ